MSLREVRENYFHIEPKSLIHRSIASEQIQLDVEAWLSKSSKNKIEVIEMGVSRYLTDLQKTRLRKGYGRNTR